jgi:predicted nucleic acid-binding protein
VSKIRTYIDANVIIVSFNAAELDFRAQSAYKIFDDQNRLIFFSDYLLLEVLPMPIFFKDEKRSSYIKMLFKKFNKIPTSQTTIDKAIGLAFNYGLSAMDALHVATAIEGKADEFVTFEKPTKPFFRIPSSEIRIVSLDQSFTVK